MKESEAKEKWCPMFNNTLINERGGSSNNRKSFNTQTFSSDCTCLGSECMMWEESAVLGHGYGDCGLKQEVNQ